MKEHLIKFDEPETLEAVLNSDNLKVHKILTKNTVKVKSKNIFKRIWQYLTNGYCYIIVNKITDIDPINIEVTRNKNIYTIKFNN